MPLQEPATLLPEFGNLWETRRAPPRTAFLSIAQTRFGGVCDGHSRSVYTMESSKSWGNLASLLEGVASRRPLDMGRPGIYEVFVLVLASLFVSFVFWSAALYGAYIGYGTPSVIAVCMESALDCISTVLVLYRFSSPNALASTPRPSSSCSERLSSNSAVVVSGLGRLQSATTPSWCSVRARWCAPAA